MEEYEIVRKYSKSSRNVRIHEQQSEVGSRTELSMSWRRFQSEIGRNRNWRQPFENGQNPSEVERNQPELEETD